MPWAHLNGVSIAYAVYGTHGPWLALSPGGRRSMAELEPLAELLAARQMRVLLHDRRNCGASDASIAGDGAEYELWADDLQALLSHVGATTAYVGGSSSGSRLSVLLALRHPQAVKGLLLWRLTGGARATERLVEKYYDLYARAAEQGGMAAVARTGDFQALIQARPANEALIMAMDPNEFIAVMKRWAGYFIEGAHLPLICASEQALRGLHIPACVIPGNDRSHPRRVGEQVAQLLPVAELHSLGLPDDDSDVAPEAQWAEQDHAIADLFTAFIRQNEAKS